GQTVLVQVTKDPIGHKGARLSSQVSLAGRFLVYVPDGTTSGISRKLPDTERNRLKTLLKEIVPDTAGVIVRTAAEGASEEELTQDVERLTTRWAEIEKKVKAGRSPELLYGEPDLTLKVVRDLFTEDFGTLIVQGDEAWKLVEGYVKDVAPDLTERLEHHTGQGDVFAAHRIDEQISKGLDRKVWLPSGGSLVIDRTEAMTVVDVNTGKFTGSGGNLEETVTKNNLEAAEEVVRQLRLRDIGGIIVIDFIDMVLESNRDLVLRRLVECLGRDRTRHQVAEVTSLGLVQMTRKRIGSGLLEAFSEDCEHCKGRGVIIHDHPVEPSNRSVGMGGGMGGGGNSSGGGNGGGNGGDEPRGRRSRGGRGRNRGAAEGETTPVDPPKPSPMALAGTKPHPEGSVLDVEPTPELELAGHGEPSEAAEAAEATAAPAAVVEPNETEPKGDQAPADQEAVAEAPVEPAAPVVVTTTRRRRAAGRPAGPAVTPEAVPAPEAATEAEPAAVESVDEPVTEGAEDSEAGESAAPVFHVPVKKRGARKR
ncbi:MAG: Rne/Rng family ribonuclease, partial [Marmoricola sp.]